jgi:hypothetical protein
MGNHLYGPHLHPWALLPARGAGLRLGHHLLAAAGQWTKAGMFEQLQALLLDELLDAGELGRGRGDRTYDK